MLVSRNVSCGNRAGSEELTHHILHAKWVSAHITQSICLVSCKFPGCYKLYSDMQLNTGLQ